MSAQPTLLKVLLRQRHWQPYSTFRSEYDKAASRLDPDLVGTWPSRAQFNRWLSGQLKGTPYPGHCRVLQEMFPGWSAAQLFQPADPALTDPVPQMEPGPLEPERLSGLITAGLKVPDATHIGWTPAAAPMSPATDPFSAKDASDVSHRLSKRLVSLSRTLRLPASEVQQLAALAGNVIDLDLQIELAISKDGSALVTYRHELFNMTARPFTRLARELWFVYMTGPLDIRPVAESRHSVVIERAATTPNLAKFACRISPALQPGDSAVVAYTCHGGKFVDEWYWREAIRRHTRYATVVMRRLGGGEVVDCSATVEEPDGSQRSGGEGLMCDYDHDDLVITLTSDYLNPNQIVTMRWDVRDESP
ncbi:MAG: hypothetical protein ACRDT6_05275 [Micromonosporaceae bacterium]